jgi:hypothetical protein
VHVDGYYLPQFIWKCQISSSFHMFTKHSTDKYDLFLLPRLIERPFTTVHHSLCGITSSSIWSLADTRLKKEFSM